MTIAYLTDVEGRWDKLVTFADGNPHVQLAGDELQLADGVTFVFGGDAIDRGPAGRRVVRTLLAARRAYGERVVLLAGNRDINKLRLPRELTGEPPAGAPRTQGRGALLRWILANTMGAGKAFDFRAQELAAEGRASDDDAVVDSYLADLAPGGELRAYLAAARLGYRAGDTLFVHGAVTRENLGRVPGTAARAATIDAWLAGLDEMYRAQLASEAPALLIAYQSPLPGTRENQTSVVYGRPADAVGNPRLPDPDVIAQLQRDGVTRVVVGHTPSGDCPAIVRDAGFELVLADNSYGRIEHGSQVAILPGGALRVRGQTELDDGTRAVVDATYARDAAGPLGRRELATGRLVKAELARGGYLLFRGLPARKVEQLATDAASLRDVGRATG